MLKSAVAHCLKATALPDKVQGLLFVDAPRMRPLPVQEVPLVGAGEVLGRVAEVALGSRIRQVSIATTLCSLTCLLNVVSMLLSLVNKGPSFANVDENTM